MMSWGFVQPYFSIIQSPVGLKLYLWAVNVMGGDKHGMLLTPFLSLASEFGVGGEKREGKNKQQQAPELLERSGQTLYRAAGKLMELTAHAECIQ